MVSSNPFFFMENYEINFECIDFSETFPFIYLLVFFLSDLDCYIIYQILLSSINLFIEASEILRRIGIQC